MEEKDQKRLIALSLKGFMNEVASESAAPGGGSVSSYVGALGVALGTMVANLSSHKKGWDERWKEFSDWANSGKKIQNRLLELVDEDTQAFNKIIEAIRLPKKSDEEKKIRNDAIQAATRDAIMVPFSVMETAYSGFSVIREMVEKGNPSSITDAAAGAIALRSCIKGAFLNVKINSTGLEDITFVKEILLKGCDIEMKACLEEEAILKIVDSEIIKLRESKKN